MIPSLPATAPDIEAELSYYLEVVSRRRWVVAFVSLSVLLLTALVTFTMKPVYQASALLAIEKERGSTIYQNGAIIENGNDDYYQTQYKLLQSLTLTQKVYDALNLQNEPDFKNPRGIESLETAITIAPVPRSRLVYVRVNSHDPKLAAKISNTLSEMFVTENVSNQLFISREVLQALQVKDGSNRQLLEALPAVVSNPLVQNLKGEYAKLEAQAAQMSEKFTPKYPAMMAIRSSMAVLKAQIQSETDKIVQSLKTELSGQLLGNNVRIIDPAQVPPRPIKPKKLLSLIFGLFGGLLAGLITASIVEMLDQSIRTQEDVENKLKLPFLGAVPYSRAEGKIYQPLMEKELSLSSESMRNLRTMIDFAGVSQKSKAMIVTSAVQGEGKTFIASNLAVVFAQLGESVLLIDGDLRRPNINRIFGVSAQRGLSDFLATGRQVSEVEPLCQTTDLSNLRVLPCGPRPPNPSELLNTPRLGALVAWARERFDRVIVDCTPMFPINDTILWGRHIPSGIFVVRYGQTRVPLVSTACQKLQGSGIKLLGVTVNSAKPGGLAYAAYGYYYQQYYHTTYHQEPEVSKV